MLQTDVRLSGHVEGVAGFGSGEESALQRIGGLASREHALLGLGNGSISVDTLCFSFKDFGKVCFEVNGREIGVELLAR